MAVPPRRLRKKLRSRRLRTDSGGKMERFPSGEYRGRATLSTPSAGGGVQDRGRAASPRRACLASWQRRTRAGIRAAALGSPCGSRRELLAQNKRGDFLVAPSPWSVAWKLPQILFRLGE